MRDHVWSRNNEQLLIIYPLFSFLLPNRLEHRTAQINRGHYVGIHTSNFKDFVLKPELLRAVVDCGFEHPSEG